MKRGGAGIIAAAGGGPTGGGGDVELYGIYEIAAPPNSLSYSNRYNYLEIELVLTFTRPAPIGGTVTVYGFHDGGTTWKCRFMPDAEGTWTYTGTWAGTAAAGAPTIPPGSFVCVDTPPGVYRGPLSVATDNPWFFKYARDGAPFHARGFGSHHILWWTASRNIITEAALLKTRITTYITDRGYNLTMISGLGHRTWQNGLNHTWGRAPESNYPMSWWGANSSSVHPSLDSFHPPAWAAYEDVLGHMRDAGIYALCFQGLFDQWSKTGENPAGNLTAMTTAQEQRLARYYMARLGAYHNLFGLSPTWEWEDVFTTTQMNTLMNFIQSSDPYNRLLTAHDMSHSTFSGWLDFSLRQSDFAKAGTTGVARSLQGLQTPQVGGGSIRQSGVEQSTALVSGDASGSGGIGNAFVNSPIVSGEDSWITTDAYNTLDAGWTMPKTAQQVVRCNWGIMMTGVITLADWWNGWQNTDPENDDHGFPPPNWDVGEAAYRWMIDFFHALSYREYTNLNGLLSGGTGNKSCFGIANGNEYVCYIDNGSAISIDLRGVSTSIVFDATWYNPLTFASQARSPATVSGGAVQSLGASPFAPSDSVILLVAQDGGGVPPSTPVVDTFTATSDENLEAHTPDTGTAWSIVRRVPPDTPAQDFSLQVVAASDTLRSTVTSAGNRGVAYIVGPGPSSPNYRVEVTISTATVLDPNVSTDASFTLFARHVDVNNHYLFGVWPCYGRGTADPPTGYRGWYEISKRVGGTYTSLGFRSDYGLAIAGDVFALEVDGNQIRALKNGTVIPTLWVTDASISAAGSAGLGMGAGVDSSTSADLDPDLLLDDFRVMLVSVPERWSDDTLWTDGTGWIA